MALDKLKFDIPEFDEILQTKDSDTFPEGGSNLYFTNERVDDRVSDLLIGGTNITLTYDDTENKLRLDASAASGYDLTNNNTDDLSEGSSNLYFTDDRVDQYLSNNAVTIQSIIGVLDINSDYQLDTSSASGSTTSGVVVRSFPYAVYDGGKFVIRVKDNITGYLQISEFVITHDTVDAYATEYGTVFTGLSQMVSFSVRINGSDVEIIASSVNTNSTTYNVAGTLFYS